MTDGDDICPCCGQERPDEELCNQCGNPRSEHGIDQRTLEPTKCPVPREEKTTPPQEHNRTPRGDY